MQHPDEGTIHAWLDGELSNDERARVAGHVATCAECAAMVAEARGMIAGSSRIVSALDSVPRGVIPRTPAVPAQTGSLWRSLHVTPARAALAASLLIAVATMLTVRHDTPDKLVPAARAVQAVPEAVAVGRAVADTTIPRTAMAPRTSTAKAASAARDADSRKMDSVATVATGASAAPAAAPAATPPSAVVADRKVAEVTPAPDSNQIKAPAESRNAIRATVGGIARKVSVPGTMQLQSMTTTGLADAGASAFAGCYQIAKDSTEWLRSIPDRFALDARPFRFEAGKNVVRAIGADGRTDSVQTSNTWVEVAPRFALVNFIVPGGLHTLSLQTSAEGRVTATSVLPGGRSTPVRIARTNCVP